MAYGHERAVPATPHSATYSYVANSPLVGQVLFKQNITTRMTTTKAHDNLNRLVSTGAVGTGGTPSVSSYIYAYNSANQRVSVALSDGSYWVYQYDSLGQVTSGKKYWSDGTPVAGQQFEYGFDDIGNRETARSGGDQFGANLRVENYSANNLNQYTHRTVPGKVDILGTARTNGTVTVNLQPTYRNGEYFRTELGADNSAGPVWFAVTNHGALKDGANPDITGTNIGNVLLPKAVEAFTHDADGNLTSDSLWTNIWNGENRLVAVESASAAPVNAKRKVEFVYDDRGRRIQKIVSTNNGSGYVTVRTNKFLYDGWNLVAELNGPNNAVIRSYMWGSDLSGTMQGAGGVGGLLAVTIATNGVHFTSYDGNGNVSALVGASSGTATANYEYSPFGVLLRAEGVVAKVNPFRFSTKFQDDETDQLYYGYRYLSTSTGRWLSRDPIEDQYVRWGVEQLDQRYGRQTKREISPYLFVHNNTRGLFDPDGRQVASCSTSGILGGTWGLALAEPTPVGEVIAAGITVGLAVGECLSYCWCKKRHPTWMRCRDDATSDPVAALGRDAVPVPGWTGPLLAGVHPRGAAKSCPGGAPGVRFGMEINYIRQTETGIVRWEMEVPVNCCACCNTFANGVSCEVVHSGRGSGGQTLPPPIQ